MASPPAQNSPVPAIRHRAVDFAAVPGLAVTATGVATFPLWQIQVLARKTTCFGAVRKEPCAEGLVSKENPIDEMRKSSTT
jgi:hypothetical protein